MNILYSRLLTHEIASSKQILWHFVIIFSTFHLQKFLILADSSDYYWLLPKSVMDVEVQVTFLLSNSSKKKIVILSKGKKVLQPRVVRKSFLN